MFWSDFWEAVQPVLISAAVAVLGALLSETAALAAVKLRAARDDIKSGVVADAVRFVEQTMGGAAGEEKYAAAAQRAAELLCGKGIKIHADELKTLIESVVNSFNDAWDAAETQPALEAQSVASLADDGQITPHVHIDDVKCGCGGKYCDGFAGMTREHAAERIRPVAEIFEKGYALIQQRHPMPDGSERRVVIRSGIRCPTYNAKVGSGAGSYHIAGEALDVDAVGISSGGIWDEVNPNGGVGTGGGHYPHIDARGRRARWNY